MSTPQDAGFALVQQARDGSQQYACRANPYLTYHLAVRRGGDAELTWEFSLGQYLRDKGFFVSGQDELSLLLFPKQEIRGRLDDGWLSDAVASIERALAGIDLVAGT